jgi:hypothetical protein
MAVGYGLVTIEDAAENDYVRSLITRASSIGLTDQDAYGVEGTFVWQSGSAAAFRNWNNGEPNDSGDEDCVEMVVASGASDGRWNDVRCGDSRPYVCEELGTTKSVRVNENGSATLSCDAGTTIRGFTSTYGANCADACPVACGSCTLGTPSCTVTYSNASCGDCHVGCGKAGDLTIACE